MAIQYVDSGALGTPDGTAWSTAWLTMDNITLNAGDIVYVDSTHSDSGTSTYSWGNITTTADANQPIVFISVTNPGSDTAPTTYTRGATITPGVLAVGHANQSFVFIGFDIEPTSNSSFDADTHCIFIDCQLAFNSASSRSFTSGINSHIEWYNSTMNLGTNAGSSWILTGAGSSLKCVDCDIVTNSYNNFVSNLGDGSQVTILGCDLSNSTDILDDNASFGYSSGVVDARIWATKYGTNVGGTNVSTNSKHIIEGYGISSGTDIEDIHLEDWAGVTNNDTGIYLDATYDGTNPYSLKTVATGDAEPGVFGHKYKLGQLYAAANSTITVELMTTDATSAATLDDSEFWLEILHPDTTGPTVEWVSTVNSNYMLGASTLTSSSKGAGDWTGELTSTNYYKVSKALTGAAGIHEVWVHFAPSSVKTVYVDPHITVA